MGHLNGILARVAGNLNNNFRKSQMPGGLPRGTLKLRFDRYINFERIKNEIRKTLRLILVLSCNTDGY